LIVVDTIGATTLNGTNCYLHNAIKT
jgi:hypothetical protein